MSVKEKTILEADSEGKGAHEDRTQRRRGKQGIDHESCLSFHNRSHFHPLPRAFIRLKSIYDSVDRIIAGLDLHCQQDGSCCRFGTSELRLFVTGLEVLYLRYKCGTSFPSVSMDQCPYLERDRCRAREGRPLGCRIYFCDPRFGLGAEAIYEKYHREIVLIHNNHDLIYNYQELLIHPWFSKVSCRDLGLIPG